MLGERQRFGMLSFLQEIGAAREPFLQLPVVERLPRPFEDSQRLGFFRVQQQRLLGGDDRRVGIVRIHRARRVAEMHGDLRRAPLRQPVAIRAPSRRLRRASGRRRSAPRSPIVSVASCGPERHGVGQVLLRRCLARCRSLRIAARS